MAYTNFKIGNNSASTLVPSTSAWPAQSVPVTRSAVVQKDRTKNGQLRLKYASNIKVKSYELVFTNKDLATFQAIENYCDVPDFYYVTLEDDSAVKLIDNFCGLSLLEVESITVGADLRYNFTVLVEERFSV